MKPRSYPTIAAAMSPFSPGLRTALTASVAAAVFSAVSQPAQASTVMIDSFSGSGNSTNSNDATGGSVFLFNEDQSAADAFDTRSLLLIYEQHVGSSRTKATFTGTTALVGGIGTYDFTKTAVATPYDHIGMTTQISIFNSDSSPVNLLGDGVGGYNDTIRLGVTSANFSPDRKDSYIFLYDIDGDQMRYDFPTFPVVGTTDIPFASMDYDPTFGANDGFNWDKVVSFDYYNVVGKTDGTGGSAMSNSISFDSIQAVSAIPEPSTMSLLLLPCVWFLRRKRTA
jgi:hypothetical protein